MPNINVNTSAMKSSATKMQVSSFKLAGCVATINAIKHTLPFSDSIAHDIDRALEITAEGIGNSKVRVRRMSTAILDSARIYEQTERGRIGIGDLVVWGFVSPFWLTILGPDAILRPIDEMIPYIAGGAIAAGGVAGGLTSSFNRHTGTNHQQEIFGGSFEASGINGTYSGSVGNFAASGQLEGSWMTDGRFAPHIAAGLSASGSLFTTNADATWSYGDVTVDGNASVDILSAEAGIGGEAGYITIEDENGNTRSVWGVRGEVGGEAYVAKGEISGSVEIFGIRFNASASGGFGAECQASGHATTGGVSGSIGFGFGLSGGVDFSVDWSGFDPGAAVDAVENAADAVGDFVGDAGEFLGDVGDSVSDFFSDLF